MTLVITSCTNRKRKPIPRALHISDLAAASLSDVAATWGQRLSAASDRFPASEVYGGRSFQEAVSAAGKLDARLLVISAGLGLIDASSHIPPYACTVLIGADDSVADRITSQFSISEWWGALKGTSPFARSLISFVDDEEAGPILAALSDAYLAMIANELAALPAAALKRVRLFTRAPANRIATDLCPFVMPYDDRLDGPDSTLRGTRSDFASRALRHFVAAGFAGSAKEDASAVEAALSGWRLPAKVERVRHNDADLLSIMRKHWDVAGGSSTRLLRMFRDDLGIACEQARFATLARQVRREKA